MTKEEFLTRSREKHGYKYNYLNLRDKILSTDDIEIEYKGNIYRQKVVKHITLGRCPEKNTPKKTKEEFLNECYNMWGDKYDYSLVEYNGSLNKIKVIYQGVIFEQVANHHASGMAPEAHMNRDYFIKKSIDKWGEDYDYSLVVYNHCKSKVTIIHKKTGIIYNQTPSQHLNCRPENIVLARRKTTDQFIKESNIIHDNKYTYEKTDYVKNQIKVIITCPVHGDFTQNPLSHLQGCGCPNCNESKGEKLVSKYLDKNSISYYRQHKFNDCKNVLELPFDFYIPSKRICIEFDGKQHFEPIEHFGGLETYERLKVNDKIKSDYCEDNFITLIRLRYDQIDNIVETLTKYFKH